MKPFIGILIATFVINILIVLLNIGNSYFFESLIDSIIHNRSILYLVLALLLVMLVSGAIQIVYGRLIFRFSTGFTQKLKNTMYEVISMSKLKMPIKS